MRDAPALGDTEYFTISIPGGDMPEAAWSPVAPPVGLSQVMGHVAFDAGRVTVEQL